MGSAFLTANWRNLVMVNYHIDPEKLKPYLPAGTELDFYNGHAYVSLVGFLFEQTKLRGISIPFHRNFEEVNLRFYVKYHDLNGWKRGVVFIKEIVPKSAITFVANTIYHEQYQTMPMWHELVETPNTLQHLYEWKFNGKWNSLSAVTSNQSVPMVHGSEAHFIAEHYWGYSRYNATVTYEYGVEHPEWEIYPVSAYRVDCNFKELYGDAFSFLADAVPNSVFVAKGSAICVMGKRAL